MAIEAATSRAAPIYASELPFDAKRIHAAAIYCSDGRFGEQMDEFLHLGLKLPRYDRVALPGGAGCLAGHVIAYHEKTALERQIAMLIEVHALNRIVLIAHEACAFYKDIWSGNRTIEQLQAADLERASQHIRLYHPEVQVECYFARKLDGRVVFDRWSAPAPGLLE